MKKLLIVPLIGLVVFTGWRVRQAEHSSGNPISRIPPGQTTKSTSNNQSEFNKHQYSIDDPASIWIVVNKTRPLKPTNYAPSDLVVPAVPLRVPGNQTMQLRKAAADALTQMFADAKTQGISLMVSSGYRSYNYQVSLYNGYVQSDSKSAADRYSARPGHSEHQTGLALDIEPASRNCELQACFADTPEGQWLNANAYKYGFWLRYTTDKEPVTGFENEPWHYRYVGKDLAAELHRTGTKTLEEFFGLPAAPDYL